jgi:3'-phosphoadenosine 5'-phosphosulfate (PAPS) 3'-phosphatase
MYPRLAPTNEWDTCAAQAIVECAGGTVVQHATPGQPPNPSGKAVCYNKEDLLNPHFVVYGKVVPSRKAKKQQKEVVFGGDDAEKSSALSPLVVAALVAAAAVCYAVMR